MMSHDVTAVTPHASEFGIPALSYWTEGHPAFCLLREGFVETGQIRSQDTHLVRVDITDGEGERGDAVGYYVGESCIAASEMDATPLRQLVAAGVFARPVRLALVCREDAHGHLDGTLMALLELSMEARAPLPFTLGSHRLLRTERTASWSFAVETRHWFESLVGVPAETSVTRDT